MKTKIMNLLAALALTAAALATPSAFGYGAVAWSISTNYGFTVNIATSQADAQMAATNNCVNGDEVRRAGCSNSSRITDIENQCFGITRRIVGATDNLYITQADTRADANKLHAICGLGGTCSLINLANEEVCDQTCVLTDEDADMRFPVVDTANEAGCRPGMNQDECDMTPDLPYFDATIGDSGGCRAALTCPEDDDGIPNEQGGCTLCTGQVEFNNQCLDACTDNKDRFGTNTECVCATTQEQVNGEGDCVDKCVAPETRDDMDNCVDMTDNGGGDIDLTQMASEGLRQLAVSGSPRLLNTEIEGSTIINNARTDIQTASFLYDCPNTGRMGNTGTEYSGLRIDNEDSRPEILAPSGLRLADGTEWAMVEPFCSYDHFIIEYPDGRVERWDVGADEDSIPFLLESTTLANGNGGDTDDQETTPPEFTIGTGGMTVAVSETNPIQVDNADVLEISITVATTVSGFMYTKDGGDDELVVSNDGVVGFTSTVAADEYEIFVAAVQNNTVAATISVYLTVAAADGGNNDGNNGGTVAASSGGGGGGSAGLIIGGVVVGGILIYVLSGGTADDVFWSPQYAFEWHNGKSLYSYGSRWDYHKENLNVYWTAANNTAGDWQYGSGATWHGDILTASYDSIGDGTMADADLSLMAHKTIGNWALQSGIRSNIQIQESGTSTSHRVNAEAIFRRDDDWKVSTVIGRYDRYFSVYMLFTKKL